jgi:hypothetical protein
MNHQRANQTVPSHPEEHVMATDPEELLRAIERTREEVAHTVDTIAGRLDPKQAAKRGAETVRGHVEEARAKLRGTSRADVMSKVGPFVKQLPARVKQAPTKPAIGAGVAALVAIAAVLSSRRKR